MNNGIGIVSLLGVVFIVLKLTDVIDWSWWWVTSPFWINVVLAVGVCLFLALAVGDPPTARSSSVSVNINQSQGRKKV